MLVHGRLQLVIALDSRPSQLLFQSAREKVVTEGQIETVGRVVHWNGSAFLNCSDWKFGLVDWSVVVQKQHSMGELSLTFLLNCIAKLAK